MLIWISATAMGFASVTLALLLDWAVRRYFGRNRIEQAETPPLAVVRHERLRTDRDTSALDVLPDSDMLISGATDFTFQTKRGTTS